jgi:hypothetical protein
MKPDKEITLGDNSLITIHTPHGIVHVSTFAAIDADTMVAVWVKPNDNPVATVFVKDNGKVSIHDYS